MKVDDVRRVHLGTFVRPAVETTSGRPQVEAVYGYLVHTSGGLLLMDTGLGQPDQETEEWYRPRRVDVGHALREAGVGIEDVAMVINCHLHFDHIGGNPQFPRLPIFCQRREHEIALAGGYTIESLVEFANARYELLDGESEILPGVRVVPTPGHVPGHQSMVVQCDDGSVVLAGQAHEGASQWSADVLAAKSLELGHEPPLPSPSSWIDHIMRFDPKRVVFAHDASVWVP